jgi:hypothetical protein
MVVSQSGADVWQANALGGNAVRKTRHTSSLTNENEVHIDGN